MQNEQDPIVIILLLIVCSILIRQALIISGQYWISVKIAAHPRVSDDATLPLVIFSDQPAAPELSLSEGAQGDTSHLISLELDLAAA